MDKLKKKLNDYVSKKMSGWNWWGTHLCASLALVIVFAIAGANHDHWSFALIYAPIGYVIDARRIASLTDDNQKGYLYAISIAAVSVVYPTDPTIHPIIKGMLALAMMCVGCWMWFANSKRK